MYLVLLVGRKRMKLHATVSKERPYFVRVLSVKIVSYMFGWIHVPVPEQLLIRFSHAFYFKSVPSDVACVASQSGQDDLQELETGYRSTDQ